MIIEVKFWEVLSLLMAFMGFVFAAGKILMAQVEKRLDIRFEELENARKKTESGHMRMEREFLEFKATLPLEYVRRDDFIRSQTVIEAKLDALYNRLDSIGKQK
ncbi:hypothetical protein [Limnobaculum xujianqingii]|uniref:hypothetical protein n=1 Tax=Limnobaculum xujianqingii TaxID=2738837 RepID=UPI001129EF61|nr:hypothetical protein [Limnobaculum xujianqingii]